MPLNEQLEKLLRQEIELLEEIKRLTLQKKDALLHDDLQGMEKIVLKEEAASKKLHAIENACSPQVRFFLSGKSAVDIPSELSGYISQIKQLVLEIKLNNEFNQTLIQDSLSLIRFTINTVISADGEHGLYSSSGKVNGMSKNNILDYKG